MEQLVALHASVIRLRSIVEGFDADQLRAQAYPEKWNVADVISHLASGAVIMHRQLDANLAGTTLPDDMASPIWDEWNAKSPDAKASDGLAADQAFLDRVESLGEADRARVRLAMGPLALELATDLVFLLFL
jgi:hypothetical protein